MIATSTNADTFKLEPKDVYTDENLDWSNSDSRVNKEHDDESQRNIELVSTTVKDWDSYDTVFIGYPIWWGIAAWPCLLYTSPSPRDRSVSRMPSSA